MIVDAHTHFLPESCIRPGASDARGHQSYVVRYEDPDGGSLLWESEGVAAGFDLPQLYDPGRRIADMDDRRIDVQVLSVPPPFGFLYSLDPAVAAEICRTLNEALVAAAQSHPDRFLALGTLPLQAPSRALLELGRLRDQGSVSGVSIGTHVGDRNLDEGDFFPVYEALEEMGATIFVHSTAALGGSRLADYHLRNLIGNPTEEATAVATLIFGGVLDAFPGLRFYVAHGGGAAPYVVGRWDRGWRVRAEASHLGRSPSDYLKDLWFDSLTHSAAGLEHLVRVTGPDRVVVGSDYPYDMGETDPVGALESTGLGTEAIDRIVRRNAWELFGDTGGRSG